VDHQHHRRGRPGRDRGLGDGQTRQGDLEESCDREDQILGAGEAPVGWRATILTASTRADTSHPVP
jgi:hypothetical protein